MKKNLSAKRVFSAAAAAVSALCFVIFNCYAAEQSTEQTVSVILNGERVCFSDVSPVIIDGRTLVPMRTVFEKAGASVEWDGETKTALVSRGEYNISVTAGSNSIYINGTKKPIDVSLCINDGRMLLPLRAVSEALNFDVRWNDSIKTAFIFDYHAGDLKSKAVNEYLRTHKDEAYVPVEHINTGCGTALLMVLRGTPHGDSYVFNFFADDGAVVDLYENAPRAGIGSYPKPDKISLSDDGKTLKYLISFEEHLDGPTGPLHEAGKYGFEFNTETKELSLEYTEA